MASAKKLRGPVRAMFTKCGDELKEELAKAQVDHSKVKILFEKVDRHHQKLKEYDVIVAEEMTEETGDDEMTSEYESVSRYDDTFAELKEQVSNILKPTEEITGSGNAKGSRKLPKLELPMFDGDVREWLPYWSQFKEIHDDISISDSDKFQFLIRSTPKDSEARKLVMSFPVSGPNYKLAVEQLQNIYGRDKLLVKVYVRDLLQLVIENAQKKTISLQNLYFGLSAKIKALETLKVTKDKCASIIYPLVECCLPEEVLRAWQRSPMCQTAKEGEEELERLIEFLEKEVRAENNIRLACKGLKEEVKTEGVKKDRNSEGQPKPGGKKVPVTAADLYSGEEQKQQQAKRVCVFCGKGGHESAVCFKAPNMSLEDKQKCVKDAKACYLCLKTGHFTKNCKAKIQCVICCKKHATVLCPDNPKNQVQNKEETKQENDQPSLANNSATQVMMQTVVIRLRGQKETRTVRAMMDSGSSRSYITKKAIEVIGATPVGEVTIRHATFGGGSFETVHKKYDIKVESLNGSFRATLNVLDQATICKNIPTVQRGPWMRKFAAEKIEFTDVWDPNKEIHVLIGADVLGKVMTGKRCASKFGPVAFETKLGWTLMGRANNNDNEDQSDSTLTVIDLHVDAVEVPNLWKLDVLGITDPIEKKGESDLMQMAVTHFRETVQRQEDGRYEVALPWMEDNIPVSDNKDAAQIRLKGVTKKLQDVGKTEDYNQVFEKWEEMNIIEKVSETIPPTLVSYLPHHPVFKPESTTTPVRPVFDASARMKGKPSLNDLLAKGTNMTELILDILIRFRLGKHGVVSDITKAFCQISVREEDRDLLRFFWWEKDGSLLTYRHCRVVFGLVCSPFLLAAVINYHLDNVDQSLQVWTEKLRKSLYVDNSILSVDDMEEVKTFVTVSKVVLSEAKFDLRGWVWNGPETEVWKDDTRDIIPVLGLLWNVKLDTLSLDLREDPEEHKVTKRKILSAAHKVFDPLGFVCPTTLQPKLMLQEVWSKKLSWDEEVPEDIAKRFRAWKEQIGKLKEISVPRWYFGRPIADARLSLHIFTDASQYAYGACAFIRADFGNEIVTQLVMAKARVAGLKKASITRLELLGCTIGGRICHHLLQVLNEYSFDVYLWTDSSCCLYWIQKNENWSTFVFNRVKEIRELTNPENWRHVDGKNNPADVPSRGCSAEQLIKKKWWEGPDWLCLPEEDWPVSEVRYSMQTIMEEQKRNAATCLVAEEPKQWYRRYFPNYRRIVRIIGWMLRLKGKSEQKSAELSHDEEMKAEKVLWRTIQKEARGGGMLSESMLKQLRARVDEDGLWHLETKIVMREDFKDFRFPVVLPHQHDLVRLMVRDLHVRNSHAGVGALMVLLREQVWILKARKLIRSVVNTCPKCRRFTAKPVQQVEAPLPKNRVRDAAVFEVVGVDLGGPLYLKNNEKVWFAVFTCAVYRAVHLELVSGCSTEAFLQALRRFVARRGRPACIYSDNGTNFEGLKNAMGRLDWDKIAEVTTVTKIKWVFNPPSAPWWGGFWERIVGLVKKQLRRILGRASLNYEELQTVLCDVESLINSRPITYMNEDPDGLQPLTPAMFLGDLVEAGVPELDQIERAGLNRRYQYRQTLKDDLRRRFRQEYLGALVHRGKGKSNLEVKVGEIVLIASDDKKRVDWPLARIVEVIPGRDGVIRTVRLKTATGEYLRPVQRICRLEMEDEIEEVRKVITRSGRVIKKPIRL